MVKHNLKMLQTFSQPQHTFKYLVSGKQRQRQRHLQVSGERRTKIKTNTPNIGIAFKLVCILINLPIKAVSMYWAELNPGVRLYHLIMVSFDLIWKLLVASVENDFDEQRLKDISGPHNSSGKELLAELTLLIYAKQAQWIRANWGKTCPNIEAEAARACWACRQVREACKTNFR